MPVETDISIPDTNVELIRVLGAGGFGTVYLGRLDGVEVAVKKMHRAVKNVKALQQSFNAEKLALGLNHENIVKTLTITSDSLTPDVIIVMEFAGPRSLQGIISDPEEVLGFERRVRFSRDMASGLAYAHASLIVHLDVKPANVLITQQDVCKLGDFGCCQLIEAETGRVSPTNRSHLTGTFPYRAPELLKGEPPSTKSDIYSYGVTLWQMMTRETPYYGENQHVIIFGVVAHNLRPSSKKPPVHSPSPMEDCYTHLYEQCWHMNADARPTSKEVVEILNLWAVHMS